MTMRTGPMRAIFESEGPASGIARFRNLLGLCDNQGVPYTDENGSPVIRDATIKAKQCSTRVLAEAIGGIGVGPSGHWEDSFGGPSGNRWGVFEAGVSTAVLPGAFTNINTWNAAAGGLLEVTALEAYNSPAFIGDLLMDTVQSSQRFETMPGIARIGDKAENMNPGDPHPRVQLSERYVTTPMTQKRGAGIDVTREAAFFDITGQLITAAESLGNEVRLRKEKLQIDCFLGVNNTYTYNGTNYSTYLQSGNWINKQQQNLVDWTDVDLVLDLFAQMTDQEVGEPIGVDGPYDLLVMPQRNLVARKMTRDTTTERRTNSAAEVSSGANPLLGLFPAEPISSAQVYQRAIAADGLALSAAAAKEEWYMGQFKRAFQYKQNFPFQITRVDAGDYQQADADILFSLFANEMGIPAVVEPRFVVRSFAE